MSFKLLKGRDIVVDPIISRCKCGGNKWNGWLYAIPTSRLQLALGRQEVMCNKCGRKYVLMSPNVSKLSTEN